MFFGPTSTIGRLFPNLFALSVRGQIYNFSRFGLFANILFYLKQLFSLPSDRERLGTVGQLLTEYKAAYLH